MITFLVEYKKCSLDRRKFLEECFSYAVHDYLEDYPKRTNKELEEIVSEIFLINKNGKIKKFIEKLINKNDQEFIKKIKPYLLSFYKS